MKRCRWLLFLPPLVAFGQDNFDARIAEAERVFGEKSYSDAAALYSNLWTDAALPAPQRGWVEFRLHDCAWRSAAASSQSDPARLNQPREKLEKMVRDLTRPEDQDRTWAEIQESLGDWNWTRRDSRNWGSAWPYYERALDWWAGQSDLVAARARYLAMVRKAARPEWADPYYSYGQYGNRLPLQVVENALRIAVSDEDLAHAHYLAAMTLRQGNWSANPNRVPDEFEAALKIGRRTDWYDDALFQYAQWMEQQGRQVVNADGSVARKADYVTALALYRRLLKEFKKDESRYYDAAKQRAEEIAKPSLNVRVGNFFLPDSEVQLSLSWRNLKRIEIAIYPANLVEDIAPKRDGEDWISGVSLAGRERVRSIEKVTNDTGEYVPGGETLDVPGPLPPGAYIVEATGGGERSRDVLLVTDAALLLKSTETRAAVWFCDAVNGAPIAGAPVRLWTRRYTGNSHAWSAQEGVTSTNGLAVFELSNDDRRDQLFAVAGAEGRQAFAKGWSQRWGRNDGAEWRIYAFTDRTAYRPGDTVNWKMFARTRRGNEAYETPSGRNLRYEIYDPQGAKVAESNAVLNTFGSVWGELALTDRMPLGEYRVNVLDDRGHQVGGATLFRLEEYKLPEFKVSVSTPEADGRPKTFLLGESVEAEIRADYYFGGPVANAAVEVLVRQQPYFRWWRPRWEYPWFYRDFMPQPGWRGGGQIVKRETLRTDAEGRARVTFETPRGSGQDFEYVIEARVTDASRREIVGEGRVKVGRQRYYVEIRPEHALHRPQSKVVFELRATDPNDQPVAATGTVRVTRQQWVEVWIRPDGREIAGADLRKARADARIWPPPVSTNSAPWRCKSAGYETEDVLTRTVSTDARGEAQFSFTAPREGYYVATWTSPQAGGGPITAQGGAWVSDERSTDIGYYRSGGLELIVDKDTFRAGETGAAMIASAVSDRWVLFGVEGEEWFDLRPLRLEGTVKLVQIPIEEKHVPNIFLTVCGFSDAQFAMDTQQVIVPPTRQFLNVKVESNKSEYEPREEAVLSFTATDHEGKPARAEFGLSLSDESVLYIQQDIAGDPREFFYGDKRTHRVQVQSSMNQKSFVRRVKKDEAAQAASSPLVMRGLFMGRSRSGRDDRQEQMFFENALSDLSAVGGVMPAAAPMEADGAVAMKSVRRMSAAESKESESPAGEPAVVVRSDFRATAFWQPDVATDARGRAEVKVRMPDSLTTWRATARGATAESRFGIGESSLITRQPLIVRLQAPRFFVVGDTATVSAVINNNTDQPLDVKPELIASNLVAAGGASGVVRVPPRGEARVDWTVSANQPGDALLRATGRGGKFADAMEKTYPVYEHGIEKFLSVSTKVRGDSATLKINLPAERRAGSTRLMVQAAPSLATAMLDALPYLANYPYGCTEQTMSRFLPSVVVAKTLRDLGLKPEAVADKVFGGIEPASRAKRTNTVHQLEEMVDAGLQRLYDFQRPDGGWGWWKEGDGDPFMTAYVIWGLGLARESGVDVGRDVVSSGLKLLSNEIVKAEDRPDLQAWMLHAMAAHRHPSKSAERAMQNLFERRDELNAYTRALLLLSAVNYGDPNRIAPILARNLRDGVFRDDRPDASVLLGDAAGDAGRAELTTARWGADGIWWRWSEGPIEATSFALKALLAANPKDDLIEPAMLWLVRNRRGAQWSNTRDTALALLALSDYLRQSGETAPDLEFDVTVNGERLASYHVTADNALDAPTTMEVPDRLLRDGVNEIVLTRRGTGALYASAQATFFSLEEPIPPAGNEIFVKRDYLKITGRPTLLKGYVYDTSPLADGGSIRSGDRVEVVATIEANNDYEYLVFEDLKPAGFEAVAVRSGEPLYARELSREPGGGYTGRTRWIYQELRDRKVALFADKLPQGLWEIRYPLRAETPGAFHALPLLGHAMYVPEIRANGAEARVTVVESAR